MISAIIITKNEEKNIARCLDSLKWVNEIVVVDSGSTDATESICKSYDNLRFFSVSWHGFGAQKNIALDHATGDWILSVDADEVVTPRLVEEILATINDAFSNDGYYIKRKNFFRDKWVKHCGWWPDRVLRLFRRGKGCFSEVLVHESIVMSGQTGCLSEPMLHFSYDRLSQFLEKAEKYSTLGAALMYEKGKKTSLMGAIVHSIAAFLKTYLFRLGVLDGSVGFVIAFSSSVYVFFRYMKLVELYDLKHMSTEL